MSTPRKTKPNLGIMGILFWVIFLIAVPVAFAATLPDMFSYGLTDIQNFLREDNPYYKVIDFIFYALLFIAVYMIGGKYAFKEMKRPEKAIAVLLGLMTAFLLVLAGVSTKGFLPYIHYLFYVLLFILYWLLLKGIKNYFWRFLLALLLTLLTIWLVSGLIEGFSGGIRGVGGIDTGGFFGSLANAFKGIKLPSPELPKLPEITAPKPPEPGAPTTTIEGGLQRVTTPTQIPYGFWDRLQDNLWWLLPLLIVLLLVGALYRNFGKPKKPEDKDKEKAKGGEGAEADKQPKTPEEEFDDYIAQLQNHARHKEEVLRKIKEILDKKYKLDAKARDRYHKAIEQDPAYLRDPASAPSKFLGDADSNIKEVFILERELDGLLTTLMGIENELLSAEPKKSLQSAYLYSLSFIEKKVKTAYDEMKAELEAAIHKNNSPGTIEPSLDMYHRWEIILGVVARMFAKLIPYTKKEKADQKQEFTPDEQRELEIIEQRYEKLTEAFSILIKGTDAISGTEKRFRALTSAGTKEITELATKNEIGLCNIVRRCISNYYVLNRKERNEEAFWKSLHDPSKLQKWVDEIEKWKAINAKELSEISKIFEDEQKFFTAKLVPAVHTQMRYMQHIVALMKFLRKALDETERKDFVIIQPLQMEYFDADWKQIDTIADLDKFKDVELTLKRTLGGEEKTLKPVFGKSISDVPDVGLIKIYTLVKKGKEPFRYVCIVDNNFVGTVDENGNIIPLIKEALRSGTPDNESSESPEVAFYAHELERAGGLSEGTHTVTIAVMAPIEENSQSFSNIHLETPARADPDDRLHDIGHIKTLPNIKPDSIEPYTYSLRADKNVSRSELKWRWFDRKVIQYTIVKGVPFDKNTAPFNPEIIKFTDEKDPQREDESVYTPQSTEITDIDLSPWFRAAKNQGPLGACVAFATGSIFEYIHNLKQGNVDTDMDVSELFHYYNIRNDNQKYLDAGGLRSKAGEVLEKTGITLEKEWPYIPQRFAEKPPVHAYRDAISKRIEKHYVVAIDKEVLINTLHDGYPISIGIPVYENFLSAPGENRISYLDKSEGRRRGGHALVIVGYKSDYDNNGTGVEAFKIRNSWGKSWGEDGYIWLGADYLLSLLKERGEDNPPRILERKKEHKPISIVKPRAYSPHAIGKRIPNLEIEYAGDKTQLYLKWELLGPDNYNVKRYDISNEKIAKIIEKIEAKIAQDNSITVRQIKLTNVEKRHIVELMHRVKELLKEEPDEVEFGKIYESLKLLHKIMKENHPNILASNMVEALTVLSGWVESKGKFKNAGVSLNLQITGGQGTVEGEFEYGNKKWTAQLITQGKKLYRGQYQNGTTVKLTATPSCEWIDSSGTMQGTEKALTLDKIIEIQIAFVNTAATTAKKTNPAANRAQNKTEMVSQVAAIIAKIASYQNQPVRNITFTPEEEAQILAFKDAAELLIQHFSKNHNFNMLMNILSAHLSEFDLFKPLDWLEFDSHAAAVTLETINGKLKIKMKKKTWDEIKEMYSVAVSYEIVRHIMKENQKDIPASAMAGALGNLSTWFTKQ